MCIDSFSDTPREVYGFRRENVNWNNGLEDSNVKPGWERKALCIGGSVPCEIVHLRIAWIVPRILRYEVAGFIFC